ncbi:MAG: hypothetical protein KA072_07440 [Thermoanaerobaculaceae bacterium]|nr:hypothetical protein [Thermoanaerobaculaceae bacterium]MDI9622185.1 S4 domain-containing protein [Acidobacteriota bacterium]HPW54908.1 S4 domain-containing protein [Thermoanaerobaculaceae bacterium]
MADTVRLDIWLDVACLARTRSLAKELCNGGKVEVNGRRAKPYRQVRPGDRVQVTCSPGRRREVIVKGVADRHIAKAQARELYEDVTPPPSPLELEQRQRHRYAPPPAPPPGAGRPEKRNRRQIERLRSR